MPKQPAQRKDLTAAREALAANAAADDNALTDQILFEARRDELAYKLIQEARAAKTNLSFGDAQAQATEQLTKSKEPTVQTDPTYLPASA
jgi:hypothetical protein